MTEVHISTGEARCPSCYSKELFREPKIRDAWFCATCGLSRSVSSTGYAVYYWNPDKIVPPTVLH